VYKILGEGLNGICYFGDHSVDVTVHTSKTAAKEVGCANASTL